MAKNGIDNYKFGRKNNWRRTVWNEIARRTNNKRNSRILYLAGEQNLDAEVAEQKGFDRRNMIAVEMDAERMKKLRQSGVTVIHENLIEVLNSWPNNHKVDVIVADFCFGFNSDAYELYDMLQNPALVDSVLLVNFQRGRDPSTNSLRNFLDQVGGSEIINKHRGKAFAYAHAWESAQVLVTGKDSGWDKGRFFKSSLGNDPRFNYFFGLNQKLMNCSFYSYKGSRVYMDSVLLQHIARHVPKEKRLPYEQLEQSKEIKQKCIAALAVQTRRKRLSA